MIIMTLLITPSTTNQGGRDKEVFYIHLNTKSSHRLRDTYA